MLSIPKASCLAVTAALLASSSAVARTVSIPFNAANFSHPLQITNIYFPLVPGTVYTYKATTTDGCELDVMTVTNNTKATGPITSRVVHDVVSDGPTCNGPWTKVEDTFDYYAQDNAGNVWYMGEESFDCEPNGSCTRNDGSWLTGVNGATPGLIMLVNPHSGDSYRQEFSPGHAEDQATVTAVGVTEKETRPDAYRRFYANCLVTKEFTVLERGAIGFKTYCANVGVVTDIDHHGKIQRAELVSLQRPQAAPLIRF